MRRSCRKKGDATTGYTTRAAYEDLLDDIKLKIADANTKNMLISSARMTTGNSDVVEV